VSLINAAADTLAMIIDCHVHLNNYHEGSPLPTEAHCRSLFEKMDERAIDHAVVITSYKVSPERPSVENILEILRDNPRTSIVEGLRWRGDDRTDLYELERRIEEGLVKGIKLYPGYESYAINDPSLEAVFRVAAKRDIPVMIHTGDTYSKAAKLRHAHPLLVDDVAVDYPDVQFIMCHLGNPWFRDTAEVLYKNDNVYADISGLTLGQFGHDFERYMLGQLREMISYMGDPSKQLMYGSDWPLVKMGPYLEFARSLDLEPRQMDALMYGTAARVFKIDVEASHRMRLKAASSDSA
jgi:uncharacterized protein